MRSFLLADNALGFIPFLLPLSAYLFWLRAHGEQPPSKRDVLLDAFFAAPCVVAALFVLAVTPSRLSWYFWLYRMDLLALPFAVLAAGFVFLGYQQVLRAWSAFALLFLVWPYPVVRLQQELGDPFVRGTVWAAERAIAFLRLPYSASAEVEGGFTSTHLPPEQAFEVIIGQVCSGTAAFIGFLLAGVAVCLLCNGSWGARARWLGLGLLLAYVSNLLRVVVLMTVAVHAGEGFAFDVVHPVLGLALFALLILVMLLLLRPFGLRLQLRPRGRRLAWEPSTGGGRPLRVAYGAVACAAVLLAVLVSDAQAYSFVGLGNGVPAIDVTSERAILPQVSGWQLAYLDRVGWTDLFGRRSRGELFAYRFPEGPGVVVQVIVADDKATLDRYPIEQCILFHRGKIEALERIALPHGITGVLIHDRVEGVPSSTLYWQLPVRVGEEVFHARVALLLDVEERTKQVDTSALPAARTLASRFGAAVGTRLDGRAGAGGDPRAHVDLELLELASLVIEAMVAGQRA